MQAYIHPVSGRLPFRIPDLKRNAELAGRIEALFEGCTGIRAYEVRPLTGSAVVAYDPRVTDALILICAFQDAGWVPRRARIQEEPARLDVPGTLTQVGSRAGKALVATLTEKAIERSATALLAAVL